IINSSNVAIALVKYQNKYWTHNDSAIRLCEILGIEPFIKADGKPGVAIKCEDFASTFIYALIDSGEDFAINDDRLYIYRRNIRPAALPVDRVETAARIGSAVELRDNQREIIKFYLAKGEVSSPTVITHADGTIEITSTPITEIEGYQIIHPGTPIFDAVIGKGIGERFSCLDCTYEIISVRNDVHLHKPAPLPVHN
ncbi:MAG: hypothetical protein HUJ66_01420, partial [Oscillospiraceae bacterium]|nr:hypothetical protein [Oscillospiraceae bacterium]